MFFTKIMIGASLNEPHTNRYYEKIDIVMYVCVRDTSSACCTCARMYASVRVVNLNQELMSRPKGGEGAYNLRISVW